jgi:hypothetical protein
MRRSSAGGSSMTVLRGGIDGDGDGALESFPALDNSAALISKSRSAMIGMVEDPAWFSAARL